VTSCVYQLTACYFVFLFVFEIIKRFCFSRLSYPSNDDLLGLSINSLSKQGLAEFQRHCAADNQV
jgi:hypothetical protein